MDESMEGWYTDPYGRHEARWMSQGTPTRLVRDGSAEASDPSHRRAIHCYSCQDRRTSSAWLRRHIR